MIIYYNKQIYYNRWFSLEVDHENFDQTYSFYENLQNITYIF